MERLLVCVATFLLVASCITAGSETTTTDGLDDDYVFGANEGKSADGGRKELVGLDGMSQDYLEDSWGKPDESSARPEGGTSALFKDVETSFEDADSGKETIKYCDVQVQLDNEQVVTDWDNTNCRDQK